MKKVIVIGALAVVAIGAGGYLALHHKKAKPTVKPAPPFVAPIINDKSDDLDRVFAACGPPKGDHTTPDTTKTFAGAVLRTVDYGHDDPKLGHVPVFLSFDNPTTGWRFRGASPSTAATDRDLTYDELRISLPCAATALNNEGPSDSGAPSGDKTPSDSKTLSKDKAP